MGGFDPLKIAFPRDDDSKRLLHACPKSIYICRENESGTFSRLPSGGKIATEAAVFAWKPA
jgi:hypothetical protein